MNQQATSQTQPTMRNGVDIGAFFETINAVKGNSDIAEFQFRARNQWIDGGHNRSTIKGFYGALQEDQTRTEAFVLDSAEPPVLLGQDQGANPVEYVLHALAGCMTTTMVYHAAARGIDIEAVDSTLEGDLDLRGFLGLSDEVRKGYKAIRVKFRVRSDADASTLQALTRFSPVYDIVSNSLPVEVTVETY